MNHANMIEDKYLKKGFIIATVCSTIIGTFTSSIGLWDKVKERRKQNIRDSTQDEEIKKLRERIEESEKQARERELKGPRESRRNSRDEVTDSFERSSALINREFQIGYDQLGRKFAIGDMATENKLQAQVITLQQTVINVLQDALESGRKLNRADKAKLIAASDAAREGSLDALRQQRQRLALAAPEEMPRQLQLTQGPPSRSSKSSHKPLAINFAPRNDCRCPDCGVRVDVESDDRWVIEKRTSPPPSPDGYRERRQGRIEFVANARFVIKCHTHHGDFACVLCRKHRESDMLCPTADTLIDHVSKEHSISELMKEPDIEAV
uniref:Uncharacterized protein n=1 Tax=Bionectria ochroleuca TaxID=29856 RepID=A0A0B7KIK8_BIOOC